ncbi:putative paf acetylhydrolase family protein [Neofusicoccum parvum]|uniref:Paf acetylhydrolase family protein n=1 Tax=Neofusicoccum parvum TaxID=310453 RepID=A0ACB5SB74_9PEZI|nr:putative paf acetylhydrolase family protein [Neofusicoccum parvum]GME33499.1 putative paf acetylhydrolase family protein [Neofusicoccum parvum]
MKLLNDAVLSLLSIASAAHCDEILLHKTTGPYHVTQTQHIFNHTTPDDFTAPNGTGVGTMMLVSIFAPTESAPNQTVPYLDDTNAEIWGSFLGFPPSALSSLVTELQWQAPVLSGPGFSNGTSPYPSILFMPGAGLPCFMYTAYLSELASWGYSVFAIDHPGESPYLELPYFQGGVKGFPPLSVNNWTFEQLQRIYDFRITDAAALLSPSFLPALVSSFGAPFNISTFGAFGHSIGGAASAGIMAADLSLPLVAGINLDGWYFFDIWDLFGNGTSDAPYPDLAPRPFLELAREDELDATWTNFSAAQSAWFRDIGIRGSNHLDFSDLPLWVDLLGQRNGTPATFVGDIEGPRVTTIVNKFLKEFAGYIGGKGLEAVDELVKEIPETYVRESQDSAEVYDRGL